MVLYLLIIVVGEKDTTPENVMSVTFDDYDKYASYIYSTYDSKKAAPETTK